MVGSFVILSLYLGKYYEVGEQQVKFRSVMCTGYLIKMVVQCAMLIYLLTLGFAQIYNGQNSYDQVLMGLVIGMYVAMVLHFYLKIHFKYLQVYLATN